MKPSNENRREGITGYFDSPSLKPTHLAKDEIEIINKYMQEENEEFIQLDYLVKELGLDE